MDALCLLVIFVVLILSLAVIAPRFYNKSAQLAAMQGDDPRIKAMHEAFIRRDLAPWQEATQGERYYNTQGLKWQIRYPFDQWWVQPYYFQWGRGPFYPSRDVLVDVRH